MLSMQVSQFCTEVSPAFLPCRPCGIFRVAETGVRNDTDSQAEAQAGKRHPHHMGEGVLFQRWCRVLFQAALSTTPPKSTLTIPRVALVRMVKVAQPTAHMLSELHQILARKQMHNPSCVYILSPVMAFL